MYTAYKSNKYVNLLEIRAVTSHRVATNPSLETAESIMPINENDPVVLEGAIVGQGISKDQPCEKCGLYPHLIGSVRDLPPGLQAAFPILDRHSVPAEPPKRRRVCMESRVITNEEIIQQLQAKESGQKSCTKVLKVENYEWLKIGTITTYIKNTDGSSRLYFMF